jgi:hypothetical protein
MSERPEGQTVMVPRPSPQAAAGMVTRREFGGLQTEQRAETASTALAARARAQVEARFVMARQFPRDLMLAREKLMADCRRPSFADAAIYDKPVGKDGIQGPSIRLAEAAARALGNIHSESITVYDDAWKRIITVVATDLEANVSYDGTITVEKTVERRQLRKGQDAVNQRVNSYGDPVFVVQATDDEILNKQNALVSKALRTQLLRLVPGDLLDEAMGTCRDTMKNREAADPAAGKKRMCDAFAELGVTVQQLTEFLGHGVAETTVEELVRMRALFAAIRENETTWAAALEHQKEKLARQAGEEFAGTAGDKAAAGDKAKPSNLSEAAQQARSARGKGKAAPAAEAPIEPIDLPDAGRVPGEEG